MISQVMARQESLVDTAIQTADTAKVHLPLSGQGKLPWVHSAPPDQGRVAMIGQAVARHKSLVETAIKTAGLV